MQSNAVLLAAFMSIVVTGCSDITPAKDTTADANVDNMQPNIKKKQVELEVDDSLVGVAPVYKQPSAQIDYSQSSTQAFDTHSESTVVTTLYNQNATVWPWESQLRNMPLSYIKSNYSFNKKVDDALLTDLLAYTASELEVLDTAFPQSNNVSVKSIFDGDTIKISKESSEDSEGSEDSKGSGIFGTKDSIKARLMNIDCPELEQPGGKSAKKKLSELIALKANTKGEDKPSLKIRYRNQGEQEVLVILTLDFGEYEVSINRSLVYSGACFTYAQFNQDQMMHDIGNAAASKGKGIWSQQAKLIAENNWVMPWDFRKSNP